MILALTSNDTLLEIRYGTNVAGVRFKELTICPEAHARILDTPRYREWYANILLTRLAPDGCITIPNKGHTSYTEGLDSPF